MCYVIEQIKAIPFCFFNVYALACHVLTKFSEKIPKLQKDKLAIVMWLTLKPFCYCVYVHNTMVTDTMGNKDSGTRIQNLYPSQPYMLGIGALMSKSIANEVK